MSLRKAINDKCKDCIYDQGAPGNWREQVTLCTVIDCPLWTVRPKCANPSKEQAKRLIFEAERSITDKSVLEVVLQPIKARFPV